MKDEINIYLHKLVLQVDTIFMIDVKLVNSYLVVFINKGST